MSTTLEASHQSTAFLTFVVGAARFWRWASRFMTLHTLSAIEPLWTE